MKVQTWLNEKFMPDPEFRKLIGIDDPSVIKGLVNFTGVQVRDLLTLYSKQCVFCIEKFSILARLMAL